MTPLEYLQTVPRATAAQIARVLGVPLVEVYTQLVQAENRGQARVLVLNVEGHHPAREWESMEVAA